MSDPNASHLEQAKQHLRDLHAGHRDDRISYLVWAIDELIRHIEVDPERSVIGKENHVS